MFIADIITSDIANGPGIRLSIFVSGCTNECKGCFNKELWDFNFGKRFTGETLKNILTELEKEQYDGVTILGGDPFEFLNQTEVRNLILCIKEKFPDMNIWIYSGYTYEEILDKKYSEGITNDILDNVDVLVDGRFVIEKRDIRLKFRGSSNQRLIDMKETRKSNKVIEIKE